MPRIKDSEIHDVALAIRPHITPIIREKGGLSNQDITRLSKRHAAHTIVSERSCQMVDAFLCDM